MAPGGCSSVLPDGDAMTMTNSQRLAVMDILATFWDRCAGLDIYEWKVIEVGENQHGWTMVYAVIGRKGDEGTTMQLFCRSRIQIWIGRKGGLKAISKDAKIVRGRKALWVAID